MKKFLSIGISVLMILSVISLAGCGEKETLKFGLGVYSYIDEIKNAEGDTNGGGEATTTVAAVLLDKESKIVKCEIDTAANAINFTSKGEPVAAEEFKTKYEMGDAYNMKTYGGAKNEWYEQVDAFESVVKGKTIEEVFDLKKDDQKGNDDVQTAGCTIAISDFILALEKAITNAAESKATSDDTLKLGIVSAVDDSKSASADDKGVNSVATTIVATALDKDNAVKAAAIDSVTASIEFDAKGVSETKYGEAISTKKELGDNYGMAKYGKDLNGDGTVKEWYEQADVFAKELIGKKADAIGGLVNEKGYGNDSLQSAGCTINVNDMVKAAVKAATV